jgi:hypothetical protein
MKKIALAGIGTAVALALAPVANADIPGFDPFVGTWKCSREAGNSGERLVIDPTGVGVDTWPSLSMTYVFTSVTNGTASGTVTETTNPQVGAVGTPVTAKVVGSNLHTTVGHVERVGLTNDDSGPCH